VISSKKIKAIADLFIETKKCLENIKKIYMNEEGSDQLFDAPGKYGEFKIFTKGNFLA
jgi:hypothetical protein